MKHIFLVLLVCLLLISLCSCDNGTPQNEIDPKPNSQGDTLEILSDDKLKADALSIAEKFLKAFFELDFVQADTLSNWDFRDQIIQVNNKYSNSGIYFEGETVHAGNEVFESKKAFLEAFSQRVGPAISVNIDAGDVELFSAEEYETVTEGTEIYGAEFFSVENFEVTRIALARFEVTWKVMDTNSLQGPEEEIHEGTVTVLMAYADEEWVIISPSITGMLMGFVYVK